MTLSIDILGLGCAAVDELLHVESYPLQDAKARVQSRERRCGGLTAAALIAASRLNARCAYAGCLGDNDASEFVLESLVAAGVQIDCVRHIPPAHPICSTIIVAGVNGTRNIFYDLNGLRLLPEGWPGDDVIRGVRALLVDHFNLEAQLYAARLARQESIPVIADFEGDEGPQFLELLELVDHLILSQDFATRLTGCADPAEAALSLWHDERRVTVVTGGSEGCWFAARETKGDFASRENEPIVLHQPAFQVRAIDTTGCGDVFHGAYAAALVRGEGVPTSIRFAAAAAAIKATRLGGASRGPRLNEVLDFMETNQCVTT